jgi:hypothetical protein
LFSIFAKKISGKKKRVAHFRFRFEVLQDKFGKNKMGIGIPLGKIPNLKKKIIQNRVWKVKL